MGNSKMRCEKLVEYWMKSRHKSKWIKSYIRGLEKIENRNTAEQWRLCLYYSVLVCIPFDGCMELYKFCEKCEYGDLFLRGNGLTPDRTRLY